MLPIKQLLTDRTDEKEVELYNALREKYHDFVKYKMEKVAPEFPGGMRFDDTWRYRYSEDGNIESDDKTPIDSKERRKLALKFHPDKCKEEDAKTLFNMVWNADEDVIKRISESATPIEEARKALEEKTEDNIEDDLDRMLRSYAFNYHYFPNTFIPEEEYERKKHEAEKYRLLKEAQEEMRDAERKLRELNDILRKDKERAADAEFRAKMNSPI